MSEDAGFDGIDAPPDYREVAADPKAAARATLTVLVSRVVVAALGWIGSIIVARSLSADEWGQFSFVFALLGVMAIVTDLGVGRVVLAKLIDGDPAEIAGTASSFIALRTVLGLVGYVLAVGYVAILQYPAQVIAATAIAGLVVVFATPGHALSVLYQSRHRLLLVAVAESLGQILQLAVTVLAAIFAPTLLVFMLPAVVNEVFRLATKGFGIRNRSLGLRPSRHLDVRRWGPMLREAIPLAIGLALTIAMMKIDVLMLSLMDTFDAVGQYSVGYKFSDIIDTFALAAAAPVSTLLVAAWPAKLGVFRQRSRSAAMIFAVAGAVCVVAFWPSADPIIRLLYGERFAAAAPAARLLVVGAALMSLIVLGIFLLTSAGKQRYYPAIALLGLALNVGLNLVLIPRMSYDGAAISTVVTWVVTVALLWIAIEWIMPVKGLLPVRPVAALVVVTAAIAAVGQRVVQNWPWSWPAVSVVAVLALLPFVYVVRMVGKADETSHPDDAVAP